MAMNLGYVGRGVACAVHANSDSTRHWTQVLVTPHC